MLIVKQLFDENTWTYTYLIGDSVTRQAAIIDPVYERVDRDLALAQELGWELSLSLDTHVHADHITGSGVLRERVLGLRTVVSQVSDVACADHAVRDGDTIVVGQHAIEVLGTPGHTDGCLTFVMHDLDKTYAFTGDALFVRGCGRTDFQSGDAQTLFHSVRDKIFALPDNTIIYPGHDYRGHSWSTVAEEKAHNPRLNLTVSEADFVTLMGNLKLSNPKLMDVAVPANLGCGVPKEDKSHIPERTPNEVSSKLNEYRLIDVRSELEFHGELGHIEGSELIPLETLAEASEKWDRQEQLLIICRSGNRSARACERLMGSGFQSVYNLKGGMIAWGRDKNKTAH